MIPKFRLTNIDMTGADGEISLVTSGDDPEAVILFAKGQPDGKDTYVYGTLSRDFKHGNRMKDKKRKAMVVKRPSTFKQDKQKARVR